MVGKYRGTEARGPPELIASSGGHGQIGDSLTAVDQRRCRHEAMHILAAGDHGYESWPGETVDDSQKAGVRRKVDGDSSTFEVRRDDPHREVRPKFRLQHCPQFLVAAPERHVPRPDYADGGERCVRRRVGRLCIHAGPGPRPCDARLHEISVRGGDSVTVQSKQLLRAAYAGESTAGFDLAAEDTGLQVADELSAERDTRSAVEYDSVQQHDGQDAWRDQASVIGLRSPFKISPANPMHATPTTTWIPYVPG